ncbi:MAG: hypothetical protein AAFO97_15140 [Pseudomonadota bacterium]
MMQAELQSIAEAQQLHLAQAAHCQKLADMFARVRGFAEDLTAQGFGVELKHYGAEITIHVFLAGGAAPLQVDPAPQPDNYHTTSDQAGASDDETAVRVPAPQDGHKVPAGAEGQVVHDDTGDALLAVDPPAPAKKAAPFARVWTDEKEAELVQLKHAGSSWADIASSLKVTSKAAQVRYAKMRKEGRLPDADGGAPSAGACANTASAPAPAATDVGVEASGAGNACDQAPDAPPDALSSAERRVFSRIERTANPNQFGRNEDLHIAVALAEGQKIGAVAAQLMCEPEDIKARFAELCPAGTIEEQTQVLQVLKHRAEHPGHD